MDFVNGPYATINWHFKSNEDIITKFKLPGLHIKRIDRKNEGVASLRLLSCPHERDVHFWPFLAIFHYSKTRDRPDYKLAFYLEGFKV